MLSLDDSVQYVKGVGPARAQDFAALGVNTVRELLFTFPRKISDRTLCLTLAEARRSPETEATVRAEVIGSSKRRIRGGRELVTLCFRDETGQAEGVFFNAPWVYGRFDGETILLYGRFQEKGGRLQAVHPRIERAGEEAAAGLAMGRMVPVYPCTGGLTQAAWLRIMRHALDAYVSLLEEIYPPAFLEDRALMDIARAVEEMHFPTSEERRGKARERLVYDECLLLQLGIRLRRREESGESAAPVIRVPSRTEERIRALFPFPLTPAQMRAVREILADLARPVPMNRLLQGDVGCGKTAVAFYAILATVAGGMQTVVMAPTEILARQHDATFREFLARSGRSRVRVGLLTGSMRAAERKALLTAAAGGAVDVLVATHAALQEDVRFRRLGLAIIDEQHKFGVRQRLTLREKGAPPHLLVMTATPIPRSLALTLYGDLDISTIDTLPPGRKRVKTHLPAPEERGKVFDFIRRSLKTGRQAYVVSPLVEENETLDLESASEACERLAESEFSGFRLALLHGRMKREKQQATMDAFRRGAVDVLVSTIVIEVGVDVPNATVLAILHAERFGLAQLHQLRGRVGRGVAQGHCFLLSDAGSGPARERLEILVKEHDGFRIAEEDLRLRGEGEFLGTRQHGHALALTSLVDDYPVVKLARDDAVRLLANDPLLDQPAHRPLRAALERRHGAELGLGRSG